MQRIDELTMNSIEFTILCNSPQFCGMERAKEVSEQFRAMKEELLAYRAAIPLEEVQALKDAEEQGRLIMPPCKVGDKVYFINWAFDSEICPATVIKIEINLFTPEHPLWLRIEYTSKRLGTHEYHATSDSMLNKTVFLTRKEAEKALKEANRNAWVHRAGGII